MTVSGTLSQTIETDTLQLSGANGTGVVTLRRFGRVVTINLPNTTKVQQQNTTQTNLPGWLPNIPPRFRPPETFVFILPLGAWGTHTNYARLSINNDGSNAIGFTPNSIPTSTEVAATLTYVV